MLDWLNILLGAKLNSNPPRQSIIHPTLGPDTSPLLEPPNQTNLHLNLPSIKSCESPQIEKLARVRAPSHKQTLEQTHSITITMAGVKSALPTHLMPNPEDNGFEQRHHGKTRSHMASSPSFPSFYSLLFITVVALAFICDASPCDGRRDS